jgi:hypothetical protein
MQDKHGKSIVLITIRIRFLDYIHRPIVLMKFTTFRRLALSPSSGEERTRKEGRGGVWSVRVSELKSKVNKVKIGINCQSYTFLHRQYPIEVINSTNAHVRNDKASF